jgi:ABC-type Fe3+-hydroxamate transport system substrate-binding protein
VQAADALGVIHPPAGDDCRIVSLVPSLTELLISLGLARRIVGRTGFCVHPRDVVTSIPKVGGTKALKIDVIRALAPTHLIVNVDENPREAVDTMRTFVPHVIVTHPLTPQDNFALYRLFGQIFGCEPAADALAARLDARLRTLEGELAAHRLPERRVLYVIWRDPWMTVARDTYIAAMLRLVNWHTLPRDATVRYPSFELDADWLRDVDLVLLSSEPYRFRDTDRTELASHSLFASKAIRLIDGEMVSWYGSRAIDGVDYLAHFAKTVE